MSTGLMDVEEFVAFGYLQEINRRLLHPMGLALMVQLTESGEHQLGGIIDARNDREGFIFSDDTGQPRGPSRAKAERVETELKVRAETREQNFGWVVQPPGS